MGIIRNVKTKQKRSGTNYEVTVTVGEDENKEVKTVTVSIPTVSGQPTPNPENLTLNFLMNVGEDRIFSTDTLTFSSNAAGYTYDMTATMKDNGGSTIGSPVTEPVLVEESGEEA